MDELQFMRKFQKLLDELQTLDPTMRKFVLDWLRARMDGLSAGSSKVFDIL